MIMDKIKAYGFQAVAIVLGVLLLVQTGRLYSEQKEHGELKTAVAQAGEKRANATTVANNKAADKDAAHAASTLENSDAFTKTQPARDAVARSDFDRVKRLQLDAERRAATYRAQAQADAAARGDLANQLEAFDRHIVEGARVVAEHREAIARRDAEVVLLHGQMMTERAVNED